MNATTIPIRFQPQHLDYVYAVLRKRPHDEVDDIIATIRAQVTQHNAAEAAARAAEVSTAQAEVQD